MTQMKGMRGVSCTGNMTRIEGMRGVSCIGNMTRIERIKDWGMRGETDRQDQKLMEFVSTTLIGSASETDRIEKRKTRCVGTHKAGSTQKRVIKRKM